mmetsp:Transcript_79218/g.128367  ORF Transcript_79218/g.128367 Transcript_79218/m.128367 type:complete len:107 (-) Transcript_79218:255-575(-)
MSSHHNTSCPLTAKKCGELAKFRAQAPWDKQREGKFPTILKVFGSYATKSGFRRPASKDTTPPLINLVSKPSKTNKVLKEFGGLIVLGLLTTSSMNRLQAKRSLYA